MQNYKFGTIKGIFIPNITMMLGVIVFLRLNVVTGATGIENTLMIVGFSLLVMLLTSLSAATVSSNMEMGTGGIYYIITRSLGIELGGAIGFSIYFIQLLSISLTVSAFAYTLYEVAPIMSIPLIELITLVGLTVLSSVSANLALRTQTTIFVILLIAIGSIFFSNTDMVVGTAETAKPFIPLTFWQGFSILFVALTGIEAGMALSGNLKNPARSMKIGNITSLIVVAVMYASISLFLNRHFDNATLANNEFILMQIAPYPLIITIGIGAATLSSALGSLLGAPRILQSIAQDNLAPQILSKEYGPYKEPRYAVLLTFLLSAFILYFTKIDDILPIYTMICLISYGLLNVTAALSNIINAPSWRPSFKVNTIVPALGAFLCLFAMFMIDVMWSFIGIAFVLLIYFLVNRQKIETRFDDMRDSFYFYICRTLLYKLENNMTHSAFTWHPQLLVLTTSPPNYPKLVRLAKQFTTENGLLTFGVPLPKNWESVDRLDMNKTALDSYFEDKNISCIVATQTSDSTEEGYKALIQNHGIGVLQPNTIVFNVNEVADITPGFLENIKQCYLTQKNVLLFFSHSDIDEALYTPATKSTPKYINLWWDSNERGSNDLMLTYAEILSHMATWRQARFRLNVLTESEAESESMMDFLRRHVKKSRFRMKIRTFLRNNIDETYKHLSDYEDKEVLTIQVLPPYEEDMDINEYGKRLRDILKSAKELQSDCLFVSSYDQVDHGQIV